MRIPGIIATALVSLFFPVLLLSASLGVVANSLWLYEWGARKYDVGAATGFDDAKLRKIYAGFIDYYNSDEEYVSLTVTKDGQSFNLLTQEETIHFKDVKGLIRLDYGLFLGTFLYILAYALIVLFWHKGKYLGWLAWGIVGGSALTLAPMLVLGIGALVAFDWLWLQFHYLFFTNLFWSASGYMLLLFPGGFFFDVALIVFGVTGAVALILGIVAWCYLRTQRRRESPDS